MNVLYVDDDRSIHPLIITMLTEMGMQVFPASNTVEADTLLREKSMNVIVCDVQMDMEDGMAYCRRLRDSGCQVPVILLSAIIGRNFQPSAVGAAAVMSKPFDIRELAALIRKTAAPGRS